MSAEEESDFASLIPELSEWNAGEGIEIGAWLSCVGNYEHAIAYARLFWPEFAVHEDCVLFADFAEASYQGFASQTRGSRKALESVMNHRHLLDLFPSAPTEPTRAQIVHLGRALKDMWSSKLRRDFPSREIVVTFREEGIEDLLDYQITFFQQPVEPP